jgi:hypothetical protein
VGLRPVKSPQTRLVEHGVGRLPLPRRATEFVAALHERGPQLLEDAVAIEALEPTVHGGVGAELGGQTVPLHTGAEPIDDAVDNGPEVGAGPSGASRRIVPGQEILDDWSEVVGDLPDRLGRGEPGVCSGPSSDLQVQPR